LETPRFRENERARGVLDRLRRAWNVGADGRTGHFCPRPGFCEGRKPTPATLRLLGRVDALWGSFARLAECCQAIATSSTGPRGAGLFLDPTPLGNEGHVCSRRTTMLAGYGPKPKEKKKTRMGFLAPCGSLTRFFVMADLAFHLDLFGFHDGTFRLEGGRRRDFIALFAISGFSFLFLVFLFSNRPAGFLLSHGVWAADQCRGSFRLAKGIRVVVFSHPFSFVKRLFYFPLPTFFLSSLFSSIVAGFALGRMHCS